LWIIFKRSAPRQHDLSERPLEVLAIFIRAKLPSGFYEPLGLLSVSQLRFWLCLFGAPAFALAKIETTLVVFFACEPA
jgi:hypothetical protein